MAQELSDSVRTCLLSEQIPICRICLNDDNVHDLIKPCVCKGTHRFVHRQCATEWVNVSKKTTCDICKVNYCFLKHSLRPINEWKFPQPLSDNLEDQIEFICCISWMLFNARLLFIVYKGGIAEIHAELLQAVGSSKVVFLWWISMVFNTIYYTNRLVLLFDKWISDNSKYEWTFNETDDSKRL